MAIAINPVDKSLIVVIELVLLALDGAAGGAHREGFPEDDKEGGFGGFAHNDPIWVNAISSVNISAMSIWPPLSPTSGFFTKEAPARQIHCRKSSARLGNAGP
jgi:hypothetical protein